MESAMDKGEALFAEYYGAEMAKQARAHAESGKGFASEQARWSLEFCFAQVWAREGLERKLRSCAVIGMLIALRQTEELKLHTKMGIKNGLSRTELEEILYAAMPYAGFPATATAKNAMLEAFRELDSTPGA